MRQPTSWVWLLAVAACAQTSLPPVIEPRGAQNEVTLTAAPSTVTPGGLLRVAGLNLATEEWKASGLPLPLKLGEPALEVLVANRPAALLEAGPARIVCQVPVDAPLGLMPVVVRRGEMVSRAARVNVVRLAPAVRTENGSGYGVAKGAGQGELKLRATGLGRTDPEVETGAAGPAAPLDAVRLLVGGLPVEVEVSLSADAPGEFDLRGAAPKGAQAGDMVQLLAGGVLGQLTAFGNRARAQMDYLPLPEGFGDPRGMAAADLRHAFVMLNGARDADGCYASWLFDFGAKSVVKQDACASSPNRQAATPWLTPLNTGLLAGWLAPLENDVANGISRRLRILNPALEQALDVELPFAGQGLSVQPDGSLLAVAAGGDAAVRIDPRTGVVAEATPPAAGGGGGAAGGNPLQQALANREIDLGDGVKRMILSQAPRQWTAAGVPLIVADDAEGKTNPQLVLVTNRLEVVGTKPFADGWLPVVPPAAPVVVRPGQPAPAPQPTFVPLEVDPQTRTAYALARKADDSRHALMLFGLDETPARALEFPEGWFAAACTNAVPLFTLELTRRIALFATRTPETAFKTLCPARGLVELTLGAQPGARVTELPGQGAVNVSAGINDVNDYLYGTDADPTLQGAAGTLFVFDSASESAVRMDVPAGATSFAQARPLPELNAVLALARGSAAGDEGLVYFDLASAEARLLPTPDGFQSVQIAAVFPATRKLLARAIRTGGAGSQYVIYDLLTYDATVMANPEGVAFAGVLPGGTPLERISVKSASAAAVGYNRARQAAGVVLLKLN